MDDFVKRAFMDAEDEMIAEEMNAYAEAFDPEDVKALHIAISSLVGFGKVSRIMRAVAEIGEGDALAEYMMMLYRGGFHRGYLVGRGAQK